jgi:hypothetical protein
VKLHPIKTKKQKHKHDLMKIAENQMLSEVVFENPHKLTIQKYYQDKDIS